jgi:hypothetical protein
MACVVWCGVVWCGVVWCGAFCQRIQSNTIQRSPITNLCTYCLWVGLKRTTVCMVLYYPPSQAHFPLPVHLSPPLSSTCGHTDTYYVVPYIAYLHSPQQVTFQGMRQVPYQYFPLSSGYVSCVCISNIQQSYILYSNSTLTAWMD